MSTPIITLEVAGKELKFAPTMVAYNSFINDMMPTDKVAPAHNYLKKIVCQESKAELDELLKRPGAALQLVNAVNAEFAPELDITVKN
ncbi:putative phage tail assembly chaperone [Aeromonas caviae]|uniref:putative phage tail assembly chaperone n=1 Tax=Aeromonas caviae TaxID=648 RepID=UPI0038D15185